MVHAARRFFRNTAIVGTPFVLTAILSSGCELDGHATTAGACHSEQGAASNLGIVSSTPTTVQANTFEASAQANATLDVSPDGRVLVAWDSRRQQQGSPGVYAQLFSPEGQRLSPEIEVNLYTRNAQVNPAVMWASDGAAWIVWNSYGQDDNAMGVVARRFTSDFSSGSPEIAVNSTREGDQVSAVVASGPGGRVLVAWVSSAGTRPARLIARVFGADGLAQTDEIEIAPLPEVRQTTPTLTSLSPASGAAYLLAWAESAHDTGAPQSIKALRLDANASPVGEVATLASATESEMGVGIEPAVASIADGR